MKNIRSMGKGLGRRLAGSLVAVALAAVLAACGKDGASEEGEDVSSVGGNE